LETRSNFYPSRTKLCRRLLLIAANPCLFPPTSLRLCPATTRLWVSRDLWWRMRLQNVRLLSQTSHCPNCPPRVDPLHLPIATRYTCSTVRCFHHSAPIFQHGTHRFR